VRSVSGLGTNTTFLTGDTAISCRVTGALAASRQYQPYRRRTSWSLEGFLDHSNTGGTGRAQADFAETPAGRDVTLTLTKRGRRPSVSAQHRGIRRAHQRRSHQ